MTDPRILVGDCREQLANIETGTIDAIITDPPYELGFMGKSWDASGVAYDPATWRECLRVLKPGGHLCAFGGTRTYHRMTVAIEDAGFEIRDSIHWVYGSGFPKSLDVSKAIDKAAGAEREVVGPTRRGAQSTATNAYGAWGDGITPTQPATAAAAAWDGWGTALKPAHEPIILARKPFPGTVARNVVDYGTGALNIDATRVDARDGYEKLWDRPVSTNIGAGSYISDGTQHTVDISGNKPTGGRWPANLILTHAHDCTPSTCAPDCPALLLDAQSGITKDGTAVRTRAGGNTFGGDNAKPPMENMTYGGAGGASRFFAQTNWDPDADVASFRYVAKPSKRERNAGLDHLDEVDRGSPNQNMQNMDGGRNRFMQNHHPTVKPVALMRWLIRLTTTADATILDPFLGSGTPAVAATLEGRAWIGCELTADYLPIIEGRVAWAEQQHDTAIPVIPRHDTSTTTTDPLTLFGDPE